MCFVFEDGMKLILTGKQLLMPSPTKKNSFPWTTIAVCLQDTKTMFQ